MVSLLAHGAHLLLVVLGLIGVAALQLPQLNHSPRPPHRAAALVEHRDGRLDLPPLDPDTRAGLGAP
jgi:hypothetical protein